MIFFNYYKMCKTPIKLVFKLLQVTKFILLISQTPIFENHLNCTTANKKKCSPYLNEMLVATLQSVIKFSYIGASQKL